MNRKEKIHIELHAVPETLLLPLWGRACHSRSPMAFFHDAAAIDIVDRLDFDFGRISDKLNEYSALYWARRALLLDTIVKDFISRHPRAWVVNLGAGLDTTFTRTDDGQVNWIDFDVPEVAAIRRVLLPEGPRNRIRQGSMFDHDWPASLQIPEGKPVLVLSGGVLFYFPESKLSGLFRRIGDVFPGAEMAFDVLSNFGARSTERYLRRIGMKDPSIVWRTTDPTSLQKWVQGIEIVRVHPIFKGMETNADLSLRLRLMIWMTDVFSIGQIYHMRFPKRRA